MIIIVEISVGAAVACSVLTFLFSDNLLYSQTIGTASVMIEVLLIFYFKQYLKNRLVWDYLNCCQIEEIRALLDLGIFEN